MFTVPPSLWTAHHLSHTISSEKKGKEDVDIDKGKGEPTVDEACWIYKQLRYILFSFLSSQFVFVAK